MRDGEKGRKKLIFFISKWECWKHKIFRTSFSSYGERWKQFETACNQKEKLYFKYKQIAEIGAGIAHRHFDYKQKQIWCKPCSIYSMFTFTPINAAIDLNADKDVWNRFGFNGWTLNVNKMSHFHVNYVKHYRIFPLSFLFLSLLIWFDYYIIRFSFIIIVQHWVRYVCQASIHLFIDKMFGQMNQWAHSNVWFTFQRRNKPL